MIYKCFTIYTKTGACSYFGQRHILSKVTTIKFSAMISFIVHPSVTTYNVSSVSARYSEVRVVSLHLRYREVLHETIILLFFENSPLFRSYYKEDDIGLVTAAEKLAVVLVYVVFHVERQYFLTTEFPKDIRSLR